MTVRKANPRDYSAVYFASDAAEAIKNSAQKVHVTLIAHDPTLYRRFRAVIAFDRSYLYQTSASVDVLEDGHWANLLSLHFNELTLIALRPRDTPQQYENQAWELINLGSHILGPIPSEERKAKG